MFDRTAPRGGGSSSSKGATMHALRFPLAAGLGLFVSLAVFTLLWTFIGRAPPVGPVVVSHDVKFTRQLVDTPIQPKPREEKILRPTARPLPTTPTSGQTAPPIQPRATNPTTPLSTCVESNARRWDRIAR